MHDVLSWIIPGCFVVLAAIAGRNNTHLRHVRRNSDSTLADVAVVARYVGQMDRRLTALEERKARQ